ncbi:MAG: isochorismatase family protein [Acidimicrobiaceae bacterium]|nr:isochorismatase family protein [Acidimicrobiaceae bacterium]
MPLTSLDPVTALVVIDLQKGIVESATVHPIEQVLDNAALLAEAFREVDLPVVLVTVAGAAPGRTDQPRPLAQRPADFDQLVDRLAQHETDHRVTKRTWGAFTNTGLEALLRDRAVTHVVLSGVATSIGVESTARQAHELGFNVTIALDAVTDRDADAHRNSVERIFPRLAESGTTSQIIGLLALRRGC